MKKILIILLSFFSCGFGTATASATSTFDFVSKEKEIAYWEMQEEPTITKLSGTGYQNEIIFDIDYSSFYLVILLNKNEIVNIYDYFTYFDNDMSSFSSINYLIKASNTNLPIPNESENQKNIFIFETAKDIKLKSNVDINNSNYEIKCYKLVSESYTTNNSIGLQTNIYSDLDILGIDLSKTPLTTLDTKILTFAIGVTTSSTNGLYMYVYHSNTEYNMCNANVNNTYDFEYYSTDSSDLELKNAIFGYVNNINNVYKYLIDSSFLKKLNDGNVIDIHINSINSYNDEIFKLDNDNCYSRQQLTITKEIGDDGWTYYNFGSLNDINIRVVGDYHYRSLKSTDIILGFITKTYDKYRLHYYTFDVYFNGQKMDFDRLITKVNLSYNFDYYKESYIDGELLENLVEKTTLDTLTPTITPSTMIFEYDHGMASTPLDYFATIFRSWSGSEQSDSYTFQTLVRNDQTSLSGYSDLNFDGHDYCLYLPFNTDNETYIYETESTYTSYDNGTMLRESESYHIVENIEFIDITYVESGISYSVKIDSTDTTYHYDSSGDGVGNLVVSTFTFAMFMEYLSDFFLMLWDMILESPFLATIIILIIVFLIGLIMVYAQPIIFIIKCAFKLLLLLIKLIIKILLLPFKLIASLFT